MRKLALLFALLPASAFAYDTPHIDYTEPYRLQVQTAGTAKIELYGTYPLATEGHPDRSQYEHWSVRRVDRGGAWTACGITAGPCQMDGWSGGYEALKVSAELLNTPGLLELQLQEGLLAPFGVSNIVRIPVLESFGAPPVIVSVDKTKFPVNGKDDDYVFRIAGNHFDDSVRVVFGDGGKYAVAPRRVYDGTTIEVAVPKDLRATAHDAKVYLRTDKGGRSEPKTITIAAPVLVTMVPPASKPAARKISPGVAAAVAGAAKSGASATVSPDAALAARARSCLSAKLGEALVSGLTITAHGGAISISGSASAEQQRAVVAAARNCEGVTDVRWGA